MTSRTRTPRTAVRRRLLVGAGIVAAAGAALAAAHGFGGSPPPPPDADGLPPATAEVTRGTLTQTQQVGGLISYGEPVGLVAQQDSGVVTWVAGAGTTVGLGEPVYAVDDEPVLLLHGTVQPYRVLGVGSVGTDVEQLEQSLHDLGHTDLDVDDTYDAATATAVSTWQADVGWPQTGTVAPGQVFVHDGDIRIALGGLVPGSHLGAEPNQQVVTYTGTTPVTTIPLDVELQHLVAEGDPATITLPDGTTVDGKVSSVGKVAQEIEEETFVTVVVQIKKPEALAGGFDSAPVTLRIVTGEREDVLMVPVTALVAAPDGGYTVEVVEDGTTTFVPVETGVFAQSMVEVSGPGIAEGVTVGVAE
ncbi:peptidoglycan-binding protein [Promicromonospora sp. MS192]|uniref:peptidoglycan-binding protein n=1 Tax=Promicromonospora sp. MS192 TaxID=3412684 RepID=UPI003C2DED99